MSNDQPFSSRWRIFDAYSSTSPKSRKIGDAVERVIYRNGRGSTTSEWFNSWSEIFILAKQTIEETEDKNVQRR